jgi:integrase
MATVYERGGSWYLNWSEGGRQKRTSLGRVTATDAEIHRKAKELELATGRRIFVAAALFDDHLERYLTWHRNEFPDSHYRVKQIADQHFGKFRDRAISQIDGPDIEEWKTARMGAVSRESVAKELRTLHAIFEKAIEWKSGITENPAQYVEPPRNLNSEPIHWYTKAQLAKLYKCLHGQTWRLLANTGLRRKEAAQLMWEHIDRARGVVNVLSTEKARTKSGRWRQIPITDGAKMALRKLKNDSPYVIPQITLPSLSRAFANDVEELRMPGSLHSLRHTYAAHLVMAAVPLRTVQVLMGHASFVTTERYAHLAPGHLTDQGLRISL